VIVQFLFATSIIPVPVLAARKRRRTTQLAFGDVGSIAAEAGVVRQYASLESCPPSPCQGIRQKTSQHGDVAADLFNHQSFEAANIVALRIVNGCAFNPIAFE
jgi:hypothetical protein